MLNMVKNVKQLGLGERLLVVSVLLSYSQLTKGKVFLSTLSLVGGN